MALETYEYNYCLGVAAWHFALVIMAHEISKECYVTYMQTKL